MPDQDHDHDDVEHTDAPVANPNYAPTEVLPTIDSVQLRRMRAALTGNPNDAGCIAVISTMLRTLIDREMAHPDRVAREKDEEDKRNALIKAEREGRAKAAADAKAKADAQAAADAQRQANQASADTRSAWRDPQTAR